MYDVIVIGAGPAGCTAAKTLAENGYKVLLAEKLKMPRYKSCSGQLIQKSLHLVKRYFNEEVPASVTCAPAENRGMIFTNDKGRVFSFEQPGLNVWRSSFDQWLADKAAESGAEIRDGTAAVSCVEQETSVAVAFHGKETGIQETKYVLDCEGVVGAFKKKLVKGTPQYITTYQTFNKGKIDLDYHYFYAYLQPELSQYDAWMNVKDNLLVLGVSVQEPGKIPVFYDRFIAYMKEKHNLQIDEQLKTDRWLMPHIRPGCAIDYGRGRILFAGEIAGFLNPMGEGISAGMESGYCAAKAVMECFDNPDSVYDNYKKSTEPLLTYMQRQWSFVAGIADTFKEMK